MCNLNVGKTTDDIRNISAMVAKVTAAEGISAVQWIFTSFTAELALQNWHCRIGTAELALQNWMLLVLGLCLDDRPFKQWAKALIASSSKIQVQNS